MLRPNWAKGNWPISFSESMFSCTKLFSSTDILSSRSSTRSLAMGKLALPCAAVELGWNWWRICSISFVSFLIQYQWAAFLSISPCFSLVYLSGSSFTVSAINFNASVEKVEKDGADYVKLTFLGESTLLSHFPTLLVSRRWANEHNFVELSQQETDYLVSYRLLLDRQIPSLHSLVIKL